MDEKVIGEIEQLRSLRMFELRERYREVFGEDCRSFNRQFLFRKLAWRLQARSEGDLSERARSRALEIADDAELRVSGPKEFFPGDRGNSTRTENPKSNLPIAGTLLSRRHDGRNIVVKVLEDGFEHEGRRFKSLSAIAREVTGTTWNGRTFFGLKAGGKK